MFDEDMYEKGTEPEMNIPVEDKLDELLRIVRPLEPFIAALPDMVEQIGPILEGLKKSPVLKMLGVSL